MSDPLQLLIQSDGIVICDRLQLDGEEMKLALKGDIPLGEQLAEYSISRGKSGASVQLFVSEDLLFYKTFYLPQSTPDLKETIGYQLGMLAPFEEEDLLYSYTSVRNKNDYKITLAATSKKRIEPYLEELVEADFHISGLYPAFLRFVTKAVPKDKWALVMQGRLSRVFIFEGSAIEERMLLVMQPPYEELRNLCDTEKIYTLNPVAEGGFHTASELLAAKPLLKEYNLLPSSYRSPEFSKFFVAVLLVLNILALLAFVGGKEFQLRDYAARINTEIDAVAPLAREVKELRARQTELTEYIDEVTAVGHNPDLISFFEKMTTELPDSAYLDQMRMDSRQKAINIQGYTSDISALTAKLQEMGEAKLKSTSRRKNQTYFNVEISLP